MPQLADITMAVKEKRGEGDDEHYTLELKK